jgi:hypothetical protein
MSFDSSRSSALTDWRGEMTLGMRAEQALWPEHDRRVFTWQEFCDHIDPTLIPPDQRAQPKDGPCVVPGIFRPLRKGGTTARRWARLVDQLCCAVYDLDLGRTGEEIAELLRQQGLAGVVTTTYSHGKRDHVAKFAEARYRAAIAAVGSAEAVAVCWLKQNYVPRIAASGIDGWVAVATETLTESDRTWPQTVLRFRTHIGVPRLRVALPLAEPWRRGRVHTGEVRAAWREHYREIADRIGLWDHDTGCDDPSRLFYDRRWPAAEGVAGQTWRIDGALLPLIAIAEDNANNDDPQPGSARAHRHGQASETMRRAWIENLKLVDRTLPRAVNESGRWRGRRVRQVCEVVRPDTGAVVDLDQWYEEYGWGLDYASLIARAHPELAAARGEVAGGRYHIICPRIDWHSSGDAGGTFVRDGSGWRSDSSTRHRGYCVCMHRLCRERTQVEWLAILLEDGIVAWADLDQIAAAAAADRAATIHEDFAVLNVDQDGEESGVLDDHGEDAADRDGDEGDPDDVAVDDGEDDGGEDNDAPEAAFEDSNRTTATEDFAALAEDCDTGAGGADANRPGTSRASGRRAIKLRSATLVAQVEQAERLVATAKREIYQRGPEVVRPLFGDATRVMGQQMLPTRSIQLFPVDQHFLREVFDAVAQFYKFDGRTKKWHPIAPPLDITRHSLSRAGQWPYPLIRGCIGTPSVRPDGSILATPGYDPVTQLYLFDPPPMAPVPNRPSKDEAAASLRLLERLLTGFPFVGPSDLAAGLSGLITPVVRALMKVAPMHAYSANLPGSGKSYLADVDAVLATGRPMPVFAMGKTLYENEVRLGSAVLSGRALWSIDNLRVPLAGEQLCQVIERPAPLVRVLGKSELVETTNGFCCYATGNNLEIHEDAIRRVVSARLDARMEFPEDRVFAFDPVRIILEDRGRYVRAALIVIRAFLESGAATLPPLASFEEWSNTVRSALVWLGHADPLESMRASRLEDPQRILFASLIEAWPFPVVNLRDTQGATATGNTAADLCVCALEADVQADSGLRLPELYDVLSSIAQKHGGAGLDVTLLGKWLSDHRDWESDSRRLERVPGKSARARWVVTDRR